MSTLEVNGYVVSVKTSSNTTFYQITEKGKNAYSNWIRYFLDYARSNSD